MKCFSLYFLFLVVGTAYAQEINQFDANGERHGKWMKKYEDTDQIRYRGTFEHGEEVGTFEFFKPPKEETKSGTKIHPFATRTYTKGSDLVEVKYFTPKGKVLSQGEMRNKKRVGKWTYYHPGTDKIMMTETYENGKLNGLQTTYFKNGKVAKKAPYQNGKLNGIVRKYGEKGTLLKYFTYKNDELNGVVKYFDVQGNLTAKGNYKNNRKDGIWKTYENGEVVKTEKYPLH